MRRGETEHNVKGTTRVLRVGQIKFRLDLAIQIVMMRIADDTDDVERLDLVVAHIKQHLLRERIAIGKKFPREGLIDHSYRARSFAVGTVEEAPADERDFHCLEICWTNDQSTGARMLAGRQRRGSADHERRR